MALQAKHVFIFHSIMAFFFGLGFLIAPDMIFGLMGYSKLGVGPYMGQIFGSAVLILGIQTTLIRNQPHSDFRQWIILSYIFGLTVLTGLYIYGMLVLSIDNVLIWAITILHILLIALYAIILSTNMKIWF